MLYMFTELQILYLIGVHIQICESNVLFNNIYKKNI